MADQVHLLQMANAEHEVQVSRSKGRVKNGAECPYLDTISRQVLDFDFEKCCSVGLSLVNVYACLVCGKYFQGRGMQTNAYIHSLEADHHMFMNLIDGRVYCLPDGYEVIDRSLDVIRYVLNPTFTDDEIRHMDLDVKWSRALDGIEYMPGLIGLNNMKHNDYVNVILQILSRITPIRNYFLQVDNVRHSKSDLVKCFSEIMRKMWNPKNFKGQVSPHEFMQTVMEASKKTFSIDAQSDPVEFWGWFLTSLHFALTKGKKSSVISESLQGCLEVTTIIDGKRGIDTKKETKIVKFFMLALDLPPAPLYKDKDRRDIIPQIPIYELLKKYNGSKVHDDLKNGRRIYKITQLPKYLVLHVKRFVGNRYFTEKNPTIVNFPVKNLTVDDVFPVDKGSNQMPKYNLIANVVHDGSPSNGSYRVHMHRKIEDQMV